MWDGPVHGGSPPCHHSHFVRFYDEDDSIVDEIADFLGAALCAGDAAILIATPEHCACLTERLGRIAGAPQRAGAAGELVVLDARTTLNKFMRGDVPDEALFLASVGAVVAHATCGGARTVRAFGEMVALLYDDGNADAAMRLEALWNGLAQRHTFALMCAYPLRLFAGAEHSTAFRHVCEAHGRVHPTESFRNGGDAQQIDITVAALQQKAIALQTEIAKRAAVEQTLRRREEELSDFLENAAEGLHRVGPDGTILWANRAEMQMLGYDAESYIGRNIAEIHVDQSLIAQILKRLAAGETVRDQPATLRCRNGAHKHVQITSNAYFDNGELIYTRCFTRDVSDLLAREHVERERNNLLMRAPVAAALLTGPDHVFRLANPPYCRMVGRVDLVGKSYAQAFPEMANSEFAAVLDRVFHSGEPFVAQEFRLCIDRQGLGVPEECFFKFNLEPLRTPAGVVYGMMAVAIDISELVQGRQVLERSHTERSQLLEELRAASRAKDEFLAMLGHELRNPLSPIVSALQLMKLRGDTQSSKEQAIIQRQVGHLIRLVDDLLDVSRITRGKIDLRHESVELSTVLAKAVEMTSPLFEQHRHLLTLDVPPSGLLWTGDPTRLAQVVSNLLANAARYTAPGGRVSLQAAREREQFEIRVNDNGRGLAPELLPHVFQLFFQGHQGIDRADGGLGIGLALVKNLVELHGGTVEAASDGPGRGSEFVVRLPVSAPNVGVNRRAAARATVPGASMRRRILVVDDNADAADMVGMLLRVSGHEVVVAHDPVEALAVADHLDPQVALLDIGLPIMDGYELGARLRAKTRSGCRLIALTGYGQDVDRRRSAAAGFAGHLVKPVDAEQLRDMLGQRQAPTSLPTASWNFFASDRLLPRWET